MRNGGREKHGKHGMSVEGSAAGRVLRRVAATPAVLRLHEVITGNRVFQIFVRGWECWRRFSKRRPRLVMFLMASLGCALAVVNTTVSWRKDQLKIPPEVLAHCSRLDLLAGTPDEARYRQLCHFAAPVFHKL